MQQKKMQPFLRKLRLLVETVPVNIAGWDETGKFFEVLDIEGFAEELRKHYKGTEQTFVRQLHFYSFAKTDCTRNVRKLAVNLPRALPGAWSFSHPLFQRDNLNAMQNIQRRDKATLVVHSSSSSSTSTTLKESATSVADPDEEISTLRQTVKDLEHQVESLSSQLSSVLTLLEQVSIRGDGEEEEGHSQGEGGIQGGRKRPRRILLKEEESFPLPMEVPQDEEEDLLSLNGLGLAVFDDETTARGEFDDFSSVGAVSDFLGEVPSFSEEPKSASKKDLVKEQEALARLVLHVREALRLMPSSPSCKPIVSASTPVSMPVSVMAA